MKISQESLIIEARRVFDEEIESLKKVQGRIDLNFASAVEKIVTARRVFISGIGKSGIIGRKIAATLASIGVPAVFLHPVEALHGDIGFVSRDDVIILLSKSGSTEEIVRLVPYLKSRSVYIISIIGKINSFLGNNSDLVLDAVVEREACTFNQIPTSSSTAALALGDALAVCSVMMRNLSLEEFARNHPLGQIGRNITLKVADVMHKNSGLPVVLIDSSFRESIIEISDKSLGCVCIVDIDGKLQGIITDGDVRRALQKLDDIRDLKAMDIMTKNPITVNQDMYLGEALALMENRSSQISVLPVTDSLNKCVGVIRIHDIIRSGL
jgi:arabinose-5-phosphate isomerase